MFGFIKKKKIESLTKKVRSYLLLNYEKLPVRKDDMQIKHGTDGPSHGGQNANIMYSLRDNYNRDTINAAMRDTSASDFSSRTSKILEENMDIKFVDKMIEIINQKHLRNSEVYKSAHIDRRLFSKIVSDSTYKPARDTCISLCFALRLTIEEAKDLLSRAGYTLSHSSKRDLVFEYCFHDKIYNMDYVNEILFRLNLKILGR